jgi:hypothetical protein
MKRYKDKVKNVGYFLWRSGGNNKIGLKFQGE